MKHKNSNKLPILDIDKYTRIHSIKGYVISAVLGFIFITAFICKTLVISVEPTNIELLKRYELAISNLKLNIQTLHPDELLHSSMPYNESIKNKFRQSIVYNDSNGNIIVPEYKNDITDLWVGIPKDFDFKIINSYCFEIIPENVFHYTDRIHKVDLYNKAYTSNNLKAKIRSQYLDDDYLYIINNYKNGISLVNSRTSKEVTKSTSYLHKLEWYFSLDENTIKKYNITDIETGITSPPSNDDLSNIKFKLKEKYNTDIRDDLNCDNSNITFGIPIYSNYYNIDTKDKEYKPNRYIIPMYIDGKLLGFNSNIIDNWMLMECISILAKDNSETNPIWIESISTYNIDNEYYSELVIRNKETILTVVNNTIKIRKQQLTNEDFGIKSINVNSNINYEATLV